MVNRDEEGTTLVEVLVAMLVLMSGVMAAGQLLLVAATTTAASRATTMAATLAAQKMEELLSLDRTETVERVDHVDAWGRVSGTGEAAPTDAVYTRRWSIEARSPDTVSIRVAVGRSDRAGRSGVSAGEVRLATIARRRRS